MRDLTERQGQVLDWIRSYIRKHGVAPTRAELAHGLGLAEASSVTDHLKRLEAGGWIQVLAHKPRSIRVLDMDLPVVGPLAEVAAGTPMLCGDRSNRIVSVVADNAKNLTAQEDLIDFAALGSVRRRHRGDPSDHERGDRAGCGRPIRRRGDAEAFRPD